MDKFFQSKLSWKIGAGIAVVGILLGYLVNSAWLLLTLVVVGGLIVIGRMVNDN